MHKIYQINKNQSVGIDSSMGWLFVYKDYFGTDILPDLLPALETVLHAIGNVIEEADDGSGNITEEALIKAIITPGVIDNIFIDLGGVETTTFLQIFWAMAKNEDPSIQQPGEFYKQFDTFPVDQIAPKLFDQIIKSSISSKNLKGLKAKIKSYQLMT